jgi:hypothetical protein
MPRTTVSNGSAPVPPRPTLGGIALELHKQAERLIATAKLYGFAITIEQRPLQPLAMGNYESVASVRPLRK